MTNPGDRYPSPDAPFADERALVEAGHPEEAISTLALYSGWDLSDTMRGYLRALMGDCAWVAGDTAMAIQSYTDALISHAGLDESSVAIPAGVRLNLARTLVDPNEYPPTMMMNMFGRQLNEAAPSEMSALHLAVALFAAQINPNMANPSGIKSLREEHLNKAAITCDRNDWRQMLRVRQAQLAMHLADGEDIDYEQALLMLNECRLLLKDNDPRLKLRFDRAVVELLAIDLHTDRDNMQLLIARGWFLELSKSMSPRVRMGLELETRLLIGPALRPQP